LSQATTCYWLTLGRGNPLSALPKDTTSVQDGLSSHYPFNAERQTEKLWIPTF